jgi:hypothetical protein
MIYDYTAPQRWYYANRRPVFDSRAIMLMRDANYGLFRGLHRALVTMPAILR